MPHLETSLPVTSHKASGLWELGGGQSGLQSLWGQHSSTQEDQAHFSS